MSTVLDSARTFSKTAQGFLKAALGFLKTARDHIQNEDRYRLYPFYALVLVGFQYVRWLWPFDMEVVRTEARFCPWVFVLDRACDSASLTLALLLGVVGAWRRPIVAKGLSILAICLSIYWYTYGAVAEIPRPLWTTVTWYTFDLPTEYIQSVALGNAPAQTMLWCIYLFIVWLAVRPLLKQGWRGVLWAENRILAKWPVLEHLRQPLV